MDTTRIGRYDLRHSPSPELSKMPRLRLSVALLAVAAATLGAQEKKADTLLTVDKYLDFEQVGEPHVSPDGSQIIYTRRWVNKLEDKFESSLWIMGKWHRVHSSSLPNRISRSSAWPVLWSSPPTMTSTSLSVALASRT